MWFPATLCEGKMKKTVWRDPNYGNDRRRARQYWDKRLAELGPDAYMCPTKAESEAAEVKYRLDSMDKGRVRSADKNAPDLLVWGEDALIAAQIWEQAQINLERSKKTVPGDPQPLTALSLECQPDEFLDIYFRKPGSKGNQ
jgi:hypothetical protein